MSCFFSTKKTFPNEPLPITFSILKLSLVIYPFKKDYFRWVLWGVDPGEFGALWKVSLFNLLALVRTQRVDLLPISKNLIINNISVEYSQADIYRSTCTVLPLLLASIPSQGDILIKLYNFFLIVSDPNKHLVLQIWGVFLNIIGLEGHCVEKHIHVLILGGRGLEILEQVEPLTEFCGFILGYLSFVLEVNFVPH